MWLTMVIALSDILFNNSTQSGIAFLANYFWKSFTAIYICRPKNDAQQMVERYRVTVPSSRG